MGCSVQKEKLHKSQIENSQMVNMKQIEELIQSDYMGFESNFTINNNPIIKRRNYSREKKNLYNSLQI